MFQHSLYKHYHKDKVLCCSQNVNIIAFHVTHGTVLYPIIVYNEEFSLVFTVTRPKIWFSIATTKNNYIPRLFTSITK